MANFDIDSNLHHPLMPSINLVVWHKQIISNILFCFSMVALCSLHGFYCLQLERFLCRECGKVKCSCDAPPAANDITTSDNNPIYNNGLNVRESENDHVEYRNQRARHHSENDNEVFLKKPPILTQQASDQPFIRSSAQPESGKLRRSFAVRSREGLENLLNFSIRKSSDQSKSKQVQL